MFDFEEQEELNVIRENLQILKLLFDKLSDDLEPFRQFSKNLSIEFSTFRKYIEKSNATLAIDCYTYAERLLKNTIYEVLEFENNTNPYLKLFLKKKISKKKYSPSVYFENFTKELTSYNEEFRLIIGKNHRRVKVYDEMIKSRHKYAHSNIIPQTIESSDEVIVVLQYLAWECNRYINYHNNENKIQDDLNRIIESMKKVLNFITKNDRNVNICEQVSKLRYREPSRLSQECKKFTEKYFEELISIAIFRDFIEQIKYLSSDESLNVDAINYGRSVQKLNTICQDLAL